MTEATIEHHIEAPPPSPRGPDGLPVVAIVGRPNVGKSTLFNRLSGHRLAIVSDLPGTTRDRIVAQISWGDGRFLLIDTGGFQPQPESDLWAKVRAQAQIALEEAQVIVFLVDAVDGVTPTDIEVANLLRRTEKPVVLGVNKADNERREQAALEFYQLGLGDPIPVSAYHNSGMDDLMAEVLKQLPPLQTISQNSVMLRLAILGRPNVGKSSFLNAVLGEERAIVSEQPGTTRDALDTPLEYAGEPLVLIDTAGIRRRGRIEQGIEKYGVLRAIQALSRCDVALLLVDATEPLTAQDLHITGSILDDYRGIVVVVNKWDLAISQGADQEEMLAFIRHRLRFAPYIPTLFTTATTSEGVAAVLNTARQVYEERLVIVSKERLRQELLQAMARHAPASIGKRSLKLYRVEQLGVNPPTFGFHVNDPKLLHFSYRRYLENTLRNAFGFRGSRLKLIFRRRGEQA